MLACALTFAVLALAPPPEDPTPAPVATTARAGVGASRDEPRPVVVEVVVDDRRMPVPVDAGATVAQVLVAAGVVLGELDTVTPDLGDPAGPQVTVTRVGASVVTETEPVARPVREVADPGLPAGQRRVVADGAEGRVSRVVQVHALADGTVVDRVVLAELVAPPVERVVAVGTRAPARAAAPVEPGSARAIAQAMVADRGWDSTQFTCLDRLWAAESGWRVDAHNARSGAHGIPQALPGSKMASAGADWRTNPATQITWGLGYVAGRYGTPCDAWAHFRAKGWY